MEAEARENLLANRNQFDPVVSGDFLAQEVEAGDVIACVIGGAHMSVREKVRWVWAVVGPLCTTLCGR